MWIATVDRQYVRDTGLFISDEDIGKIEVTSGVRAAFYAMVAAAFVLMGLMPIDIRFLFLVECHLPSPSEPVQSAAAVISPSCSLQVDGHCSRGHFVMGVVGLHRQGIGIPWVAC